jgi:hypothetical protein
MYIFLPALWSFTFQKLLFQYRFVCMSTFSVPKAHITATTPLRPLILKALHVPASFSEGRWSTQGSRCAQATLHADLHHREQKCVGLAWWHRRSLPYTTLIHTFAFVNPVMFRIPVANSLWILKWRKNQGKATCALVRKQQPLCSPTWTEKQKGKMKNRSLNSRLAVMFLGNW